MIFQNRKSSFVLPFSNPALLRHPPGQIINRKS
jgi:hypothetical protein